MSNDQIPTPTKRKKTRVKARIGSGSVATTVCITKGAEVKRLSRLVADNLVATEGWNYAPRSLWKKEVRDVKGYSSPVVEQKEVKKKKKPVKADKPRKGKENKA